MASKNFSNSLNGIINQNPGTILTTSTPKTESPKQEVEPVKKRKPGRPKTREVFKVINIAVPEETMNKVNIAKAAYHDNLTAYINKLIEKDLEANFEKYQNIYNMLKDI